MKKALTKVAAGVVLSVAVLAGVLGFNASSSAHATAVQSPHSHLLADQCYAGEGHCLPIKL